MGVLAALGVSVCSGFASVYLEKILKGDKTPLLVRNVQLCIFSIPLQLFAIYQRDYSQVLANGWLHGFCLSTWLVITLQSPPQSPPNHPPITPQSPPQSPPKHPPITSQSQVVANGWLHGFCLSTWLVVCMFAFGGLLVALVIRFADNNLKNLAMAVAILVSCAASVPLFDFKPNEIFAAGALLVIISIFLYAWAPKTKVSPAFLPVPTSAPGRGS